MNIKLIEPTSPAEFRDYYHLRWKVLREPWNMPPGSERIDDDNTAHHIMAVNQEGKVLGTGRIHLNEPNEAQIRFMAIDESCRKSGVGTLILRNLENLARNLGAKKMMLQARDYAIPFYEKNGYEIVEKTYLLFDQIQHYKMDKQL